MKSSQRPAPRTRFSSQNFMPLGEGVPLERGRQRGVPPKKTLFCRYWLI